MLTQMSPACSLSSSIVAPSAREPTAGHDSELTLRQASSGRLAQFALAECLSPATLRRDAASARMHGAAGRAQALSLRSGADRAHTEPMAGTGRSTSESRASANRPHECARIVVGVDASQGSTNALLWAFAEARARKIPIHAVLAWQYHPPWVDPGMGSMFPLGYQPQDGVPQDAFAKAAAAVNNLLDAAIRTANASDPDSATDPVPLTQETVEGHPAQVLLDGVGESDIMVVGSHGHGGFVGAILGSISQHVVSHSRCPVVVIPAPQREPEGSASCG